MLNKLSILLSNWPKMYLPNKHSVRENMQGMRYGYK